MYCAKSPGTTEDIIKKSRFIGVIVPVADETAIHRALQQLHQQHPAATHIAFAFRLLTPAGTVSRFHDAGEPSGTAGKPIFQHLEGKDLINTLVAVIRYFGGIKLGAGGLTRAYGNAARAVIEAAEIVPYVEYQVVPLRIDYKDLQALEYQLKQLGGRILEQSFGERIELLVSLPKSRCQALLEQFGSG